MKKHEFLSTLEQKLSGVPKEDSDQALEYYSEMIDERMDDGASEEDAVAMIGSPDEIAAQILTEIPLAKLVKKRVVSAKKWRAWEIVLLALGSPIWVSLLIAACAVILSLCAVLWSLIVSVWAVFGALAGGALGGIAGGVLFFIMGNLSAGLIVIAAAIVCAGLSIFAFFGCKAATKGMIILTKKIVLGIKKCFLKKEEA